MQHLSDTPPDGDFVRYVERLTDRDATTASVGRDDMLKAAKIEAGQPAPQELKRHGGAPAPVSTLPFAGIAVWSHLKWLVALWVGIQLLASFLPWTGFLFLPAVVAYAGWVIFKVKRHSSGDLIARVRELLAHAVHEASKSPPIHPPKPK